MNKEIHTPWTMASCPDPSEPCRCCHQVSACSSSHWYHLAYRSRFSGTFGGDRHSWRNILQPHWSRVWHRGAMPYHYRSIGAHHFERFAKWQSLVKAMASLFHIVQCFKSKRVAKNKTAMDGIIARSLTRLLYCPKQRPSLSDVCKRMHTKLSYPVWRKEKTFLKTIPWGSSTLFSMTMDSWG